MKKFPGFTLLETMIALSILALTVVLSFQQINHLLQRGNDEVMRFSLIRMIAQARTQSDILQRTISICKSSNQQQCGGDWSVGLLLFMDDQEDGQIHDAQQIISSLHFHKKENLHARFYPFYRDFLQFHPVTKASNDNGTFWSCQNSKPKWAVTVNRMGVTKIILPNQKGEIEKLAVKC